MLKRETIVQNQLGRMAGLSYRRGPRKSPWEQKSHTVKRNNAPKWVRSLQRTDCPIPKLAFFFLFCLFFSIFFFCCCLAPVQ